MNTLGNKTKRVAHKEESYSINHSFVAKEDCPHGAIVVLDENSGEIEPFADNGGMGNLPVGVVTVAGKKGELVTVCTYFNGIYRAKASGSIKAGNILKSEGLADDKVLVKYKKADVGGLDTVAVAMSIQSAEDEDDVLVGVLRQPFIV